MEAKNYELLEHTADTAIRVTAADLEGLFKNAALAMFDIIAEDKNKSAVLEKIEIKQSSENLGDLLVGWLNELLSLSATKELIFSDFRIDKLTDNLIEAQALGSNISNFKINTEIKAATYHQLKVEKTKSGWLAEIIFDV